MAFELNQTAVSAVALLRAIDAGGWTSNRELAVIAGRPPQNIARDLSVIRNEGLIEADRVALSDKGKAQLAAIARAEGAAPDPAAPQLADDERLVTHAQMRPDDENNPRKDFESEHAQEKLDELRQSILRNGLLQNLVCRPDPHGAVDYVVTAGNRRWHAIAQAIYDNDWPEDRLIRIKVRDGDDRENLLTAVVENMQRANMSKIEEAEAFGDLVNKHGMKTLDISAQSGLSQKVIQNRLKLLKLSTEDQERMRLPDSHPDHLGYKAALAQLTVSREPQAAEPAKDLPGFSAEVIAAAMSEDEEAQRRGWGSTCLSGRTTTEGEAWPEKTEWAEAVVYDFSRRRQAAIRLTRSSHDRWHVTLSTQDRDSYSGDGYGVSTRDPIFPSRRDAVAHAIDRICARLGDDVRAKLEPLLEPRAVEVLPPSTADEPGSPAETPAGAETPSLGKSLTPAEALILAEVTDAVERCPHPIHPSYTFCLPSALQADIHHLAARELLATRQIGDATLIRTALLSGGVKAWLESIGFYADREAVLFELAARIEGAGNVTNRQMCGVRYASPWLNLTGDLRNEVAEPAPVRDRSDDTLDAMAYSMAALEPEQPALIEETAEEKAARREAECNAREAAGDEEALTAFVGLMREKLAKKRADGRSGWRTAAPRDLADLLVGHVGKGDPVDIAILSMMLAIRAGAMSASGYLRSMTTPQMERLMIEARAARWAPSEEPDPKTNFIEAELDDAEAEVDSGENLPIPPLHEPAVPIRKSITADFIVCLEDGRKFKSLKRHLRVKYNLSPEEYRAKWGLPADYPMVAPNYAKARAELAAQMGLRA